MGKKNLTTKLNETISLFKCLPEAYDDNVWKCYVDCKRIIKEAEKNHEIPYKDYTKYIDIVTAKLGI